MLAEIFTDFDNVMSWAFEECCRRWLGVYAPEGRVGAPEEVGSWWSRDGKTQIDVVGIGKQRYSMVAECKWRRVVDVDLLGKLEVVAARLGVPQ